MRALVPGLVLLPALLAVASPALAQSAAERRAAAAHLRDLTRDADAALDEERWDDARTLYRQVHELDPSARTFRGMGIASFALRDYPSAIRELLSALADERRPLTRTQRQQVGVFIARAQTYVGHYTVRILPPGATARVDGDEVDLASELVLARGRHTLRAERAGYLPIERRIEVRGGERLDLELRMQEGGTEVEEHATTGATSSTTTSAPPRPPPVDYGYVPTGLFVGAAVAGAVGLAGAIWTADRASQLGSCERAGGACLNHGAIASQRDAAIGITVAGFLIAAGLGATGGVLFYLDHEDDGRSAFVACGPDIAGVYCRGAF